LNFTLRNLRAAGAKGLDGTLIIPTPDFTPFHKNAMRSVKFALKNAKGYGWDLIGSNKAWERM
jgi:hypothetical protein